jgi:uncharacterized protein HemY
MLLFSFTLVAAALGVGAYAHYNPGTLDVTLSTYRFAGIPRWEVVAVAAGVPLVLFLLNAVYVSVRIRLLRRANGRYTTGRTFNDLPSAPEPQPAPKRSWTTPRE